MPSLAEEIVVLFAQIVETIGRHYQASPSRGSAAPKAIATAEATKGKVASADKAIAATQRFITFSQAAVALGVNRKTVERMVERGELVSKKVSPGCVRITRQSWDAYLANL